MNSTRLTSMMAGALLAASLGAPNAHGETATIKGGFALGDPAVMNPGRCPCADLTPALKIQSQQANYVEGAQRVSKWIAAHPGSTLMAFSVGTSIALGAIRDHKGDATFASTSFLFLGSPDSPRNASPYWSAGWQGKDGKVGPPTSEEVPDQSNTTYVVREYDPVSDYPADTWNFWAQLNLSVATHFNGYTNVDLDDPRNVVEIDSVTGRKTVYLPSDVLPMLQGRAWYTGPARMAQLDAIFRPLIDAAYVGQRPVINAGPNAAKVASRAEPIEAAKVQKAESATASGKRAVETAESTTASGKRAVETAESTTASGKRAVETAESSTGSGKRVSESSADQPKNSHRKARVQRSGIFKRGSDATSASE